MNENYAYPLDWPAGWTRTPSHQRERGQFKGTQHAVVKELLDEVDKIALGGNSRSHTIRFRVVISTNMPLRNDGLPRADRPAPADPGAAVYFTRKEKRVCFACDKYDAVWKNLRAIQHTIAALRGIERWGSTTMLERAFTGFAALPASTGPDPWETLGITRAATEADILSAFRRKAQAAHPDQPGGSTEAFLLISQAKDIALATLRSRTA